MASVPRPSYVSFNHLHKKLIPVSEESDDSEEERPQKKEAWRKHLRLPDYRKVKIGEYYDEDLDTSYSGESDLSARSSFESDTSVEPKTPTQIPKVCSGCNVDLTPVRGPTLTPAIERVTPPCKLSYSTHSRSARRRTPSITQYLCQWPGCKIILCIGCAEMMVKPKSAGGMGGSLPALHTYLDQQRSLKSPSSDGSITADIVQAITSTSKLPHTIIKTIEPTDHADENSAEKSVANTITQKELPKLESLNSINKLV